MPRLKKLVAVAFLLFVGLWVAGVVRSFFLTEPDLPTFAPFAVSLSSPSGDYRSGSRMANNLAQIGLLQTPLPQLLDQPDVNPVRVYDKTAELLSVSTDFGDDEGRIRKVVAGQKAVVFSERSSGVNDGRMLVLGISVHSSRFDELVRQLEQVGQPAAIQVVQQDRTAEFRKLFTERQSLKKYADAILKLRDAKNLSVEESLKLEQKILELEKQIQAVALKLGDFLGSEPSYTLIFTLAETQPGGLHERTFTLARRLGSGFLWALGWWSLGVLGISLGAGTLLSVHTLRAPAPAYPVARSATGKVPDAPVQGGHPQ
jgi:hypothetical protein